MTVDQCKARILANLSPDSRITYDVLRSLVSPDYAPIFARALKELIINGEVERNIRWRGKYIFIYKLPD